METIQEITYNDIGRNDDELEPSSGNGKYKSKQGLKMRDCEREKKSKMTLNPSVITCELEKKA